MLQTLYNSERMIRFLALSLLITFFSPALLLGQTGADPAQTYFNEGVDAQKRGAYADAYDSFTKCLDLLSQQDIQDSERVMAAHLWAGASAFQLGHAEQAQSHYLKSLELAIQLDSVEYQVNINNSLANLFASRQDYDRAARRYIESGSLYLKMGKSVEARNSRDYGAYMLTLAARYEEALPIIDQSLKQSPPDRPDREVAWLYTMRGTCHYYLEHPERGLEDYFRARILLSSAPPSMELARAYGWLGTIYSQMGINYRALASYNRSIEIAKQAGSEEDRLRALGGKGSIYANRKLYRLGALYYEAALDLAIRLHNDPLTIASYESLAWIYTQKGDHVKSIQIYEKLIPIYKRFEKDEMIAESFNKMGMASYSQKKYSDAERYYLRSLDLYRILDQTESIAVLLFNLGVNYHEAGDARKAALAIEDGLKINMARGDRAGIEDSVALLSEMYEKEHAAGKLIRVLETLIPLFARPGKERELSNLYNNIGLVYFSRESYPEAIEYYKRALKISLKLDNQRNIAIQTYNIGRVDASLSRFDLALEKYSRSLDIARREGYRSVEANLLNATGELYRAWGWYDKSIQYYKNAEQIFKESNDSEGLVSVNNNMGQAIRQSGKPDESIVYYKTALQMNESLNDPKTEALLLSNLGEAYRESGDNETSLQYYLRALKEDTGIRNLRGINIRRNNIGLIYQLEGEQEKAIEYFQDHLDYSRSIGAKKEEATGLTNIARSRFYMGDYDRAAKLFTQAIAIHEDLRLTARGAVRREYLASQIAVYRDLALTYFEKGDLLKSVYALELSRAKYLLEQMGDSSSEIMPGIDTISAFQGRLKRSEAVLSVASLGGDVYQLILMDTDRIASTVSVPDRSAISNLYEGYGGQIRSHFSESDKMPLEGIFHYYRYLLAKPIHSRRDQEAFVRISGFLYGLWIDPLREQIGELSSLIIVPDGILGTIPFETLTDRDGHYLIEKYDISYVQSITVAERSFRQAYPAGRKPMLAMGGALYNSDAASIASRGSIRAADIDGIRREANHLMDTGASARAVYNRIGYNQWSNLPGSLAEVERVSQIVAGTELKKGPEVDEAYVKKLSADGDLARFRVIHLATHGIVIPEVPELSAVILSIQDDAKGDNDGYLTMKEISKLKMEADFVNLSACETGLGKIYDGEGIVGLSQAFLVAGAKAMSVSLWQVSDESTMKFMSGLYSHVKKDHTGFSHAMSQMKREFIKNNRYSAPFYWAPFIFYGDNRTGLKR